MAVEHWIRYQLAVGAGCNKTGQMLSYFGSVEQFFQAGEFEWRISGIFTSGQLSKLITSTPEDALPVLEKCKKHNCSIVTPDDSLYPRMLKLLDDLPAVLYYQGDLRFLIHKVAIAIVGTREAGENSLAVAKSLSGSIIRSGAIIVSGGALGVDSAAHTGAIEAGGKTVAVLGCGIGTNYLQSNSQLRQKIAENGALITEYPPETPALTRNFPVRNRIISGLCHGTVVVEAGIKSGSLLTANSAVDQGRDIYAVPGDVMSSKFLGVNKLINEGAKPVFSAYDVLYPYAIKYPKALDVSKIEKSLRVTDSVEHIKTKSNVGRKSVKSCEAQIKDEKQETASISFEADTVLNVLGSSPIHIDDIVRKTQLDFATVFSAITELELMGMITSQPGKFYILK